MTSSSSPYVAPDSQINDPTGGAVLGTRLSTAASIPTTGAYVIGDVVYNTAPAANEPTVGWYRLVTGTAHVLGTDWAALNIPTDVKFGTNSISFTWAGSDCQTGNDYRERLPAWRCQSGGRCVRASILMAREYGCSGGCDWSQHCNGDGLQVDGGRRWTVKLSNHRGSAKGLSLRSRLRRSACTWSRRAAMVASSIS
jgi:hypothetical protein